jgi:hypothetical protein
MRFVNTVFGRIGEEVIDNVVGVDVDNVCIW